ncbi:FMN reductase [Paenibacillus sp. J31TS4]|uniref:NADPH-dependent FMN reductase n=1 Tax=Paenibacillus sp. J31TS4 TaxID=2807195 RepID=UPI001B19B425|nr:NAD(P)H-dependent oxidoreductase [Paenibacillus sp. J31TS4]GIP38399.1 FMN reductase [Paenibacillus sp. J31TS4]
MNIAILTGSNREASTSTRLAETLGWILQEKGHRVERMDLYRTPLPFYSPEGLAEGKDNVAELKRMMREADGIILATPEYHGSMSGVLKNALDHLGKEHFSGKPVLAVSSSGGAVGVSSLQQIQAVVRNLHGINCPDWLSIGGAHRQWFDPAREPGEIRAPEIEDRIRFVLDTFLRLGGLLRGREEIPQAAEA